MSKKKALSVNKFSLLILLLSGFLGGCSRCEECTKGSNTETICDTEFDDAQQYEDAIADREAAGAVCSASSGF